MADEMTKFIIKIICPQQLHYQVQKVFCISRNETISKYLNLKK